MEKKLRSSDFDAARKEIMNDVHNESNLFTPGKDFNEKYEGRLKYIDDSPKLTADEKFLVKERVTKNKDVRNLLDYKSLKYPCATNTCNRYGYTISICEHCSRDALERNFANWTSGNAEIDEQLRISQINCPLPVITIEWIEYEKLQNIKKIAEGGCAVIYNAEWTEGRLSSIDNVTQTFHRSGPSNVILKCFKDTNDPNGTFVNELKTHILLDSSSLLVVKAFGISRHPKTGEFILVMENMEYDLKTYIKKHRDKLTSKEVYGMFWFAFSALGNMHKKGLLHRDFHFGNLLKRSNGTWLVSDFGLSGAQGPSDSVYGILEFIAPEVIGKKCKEYTSRSDVYSCGMLMYYVATGNVPFYDFKNRALLALYIVDGGRPSIPSDIPKPYADMMRRCWKEDPDKRPTASELARFCNQQLKDVAENEMFGSKIPSAKMSKMPQSAFHFSVVATGLTKVCMDSEQVDFVLPDENSNNTDFSLPDSIKEENSDISSSYDGTKEQRDMSTQPGDRPERFQNAPCQNRFSNNFLTLITFLILYGLICR